MPQAIGTSAANHSPAMLIANEPLPIKYLQTLGATLGQVPSFNGTTVVWATPAVAPGAITLNNAHILVGNVGNLATDVAVSGDLTLANTGAFTIANAAVTAVKIGATFPFVGAALAAHSHDLQTVSAEALTVNAGTGVSSAASTLPIAIVESVYVTAGGVTGAVTVIPAGQTPATKECTYNPTTGVFQFLIADAVTDAVITYMTRPVTSVSAGTPAGTITPA